MIALLAVDGGVLEDGIGEGLWTDAHVLLAEMLDLSVEVGEFLERRIRIFLMLRWSRGRRKLRRFG